MTDWRISIAARAYEFIEDEVRPFLARGGNLHTKGSAGYPAKLRQMLTRLDKAVPVTYSTAAALLLIEKQRQIEHVTPLKRIVIEIVDPSKADPRSNTSVAPIAGGPAASPEHLLEIFDRLVVKCWVTSEEHARLNTSASSHQWDAPNGNGWSRYKRANIVATRIAQGHGPATGETKPFTLVEPSDG